MTDKKQPEALAFCWATELAMTQQPVTLSVTEAREVSAEMQRQHAELETLRTGYDAARLEIESLKAQLHAAKQINTAQFWLLTSSIPGSALRVSHWQAPAQAAPAYKDSTPELHVGDSAFESWYSSYNPTHKGDKQRARDAYAAGMGDPLVMAALFAPTVPASPAFVYAGERGADLEGLLDGYDHGTAFYTTPQQAAGKAVHQFRKQYCADWYDGHADHGDSGGPYEERTLYTVPQPVAQGCALDVVLDAFENKTRGIPQAHIAAALVAELRAAIDAARAAQEGKSHDNT